MDYNRSKNLSLINKIRKAALIVFIFFLCLFSIGDKVFAVSLFSSDFENQNMSGWTSSGGGASATISSELSKSGNYSLKVQHDKTSSYGYQILIPNIEGGMFYQAQAFGKSGDISTDSFFIRIAWYSSSDGSGSQLSIPSDSNQSTVGNDWAELKTNVIQAPSLANSAKFRLVLTSKSQGTLASAFFDNVSFEEAIAPTSTPIPIPTPTLSPTNTPTISPTSVPTIVKASLTISGSQISTKTAVLGQSSESATNNKIPKDNNIKNKLESPPPSDNKMIAKIFIGLGIVFLLLCAIVIFYPYINKLKKEKLNGE